MEKTKLSEKKTRSASALILAVVLTSLLAIIGTVFLMVARVDKIATSAITENKELQFALESVVAEISQQLALDVPHSDPNRLPQEYYDYPDPCNAWLASLEPNDNRMWQQISDVSGFLSKKNFPRENVDVDPPDIRKYIPEYPEIRVDSDGEFVDRNGNLLTEGLWADADGDGIADSKWIQLDDITSNKGKPIYAAIRIIDNGGMINVNTARQFDPTSSVENEIDGSSQMQINLLALAARGSTSNPLDKLDDARFGSELHILDNYIRDVIWRYGKLLMPYTPFDISDELKLRNRYILNYNLMTSRIEELWENAYDGGPEVPLPTDNYKLTRWFDCTSFSPAAPNDYDYRHISTTYNMDRIITPDGPILNYGKMLNINRIEINPNDPNIFDLYNYIRMGFADAGFVDDSVAAQLAVNIKDFHDSDAIVSSLNLGGPVYYGFEAQPFISEIGIKIDPNDSANNHFAVELYNPFNIPIPLDDFTVELYNPFNIPIPLDDFKLSLYDGTNLITDIPLSGAITIGPNDFLVVVDDSTVFNPPNWYEDPNLKLSGDYNDTSVPPDGTFEDWDNYDIALKRYIPETGTEIYLDNQPTQNSWFAQGTVKYVQRDSTNWHIVYEDVNDSDSNPDTLGFTNDYRTNATNYNLALANHDFITIGDIVLPLKIGPNTTPYGTIGRKLSSLPPPEDRIRINLADPAYQQIFNYLTVMDPNELQYGGHPATETRVKGRININTAPWFVIAQLPWVRPQLAQKIVEYRDTIAKAAFESIGELNNVINDTDPCLVNYINYYARDFDPNGLLDQLWFPDLTPGDGVPDDFEERNLIFSRISNLVTVRSDVFTAYILVRIGADGPQKRAIAILDRSEVSDISGRVKLIALHPVPDPR